MDSVQYVITDKKELIELKDKWILQKSLFSDEEWGTTGGYIVSLYQGNERVFSMDIIYGDVPGKLWCGDKGGILIYNDLEWLNTGSWTQACDLYQDFNSKDECDKFLDSLVKHSNFNLMWRTDNRIAVTIMKE